MKREQAPRTGVYRGWLGKPMRDQMARGMEIKANLVREADAYSNLTVR